jgi:predicted PurR-regulated permease PerM
MDDHIIHQNRIRQIFFLACIVLLGALLATKFATFLPALLGAITLYIIMRKMMLWITTKWRWSKSLAASMLMLASFLVLLVPVAALVAMLSSKVTYAITHSNELVLGLQGFVQNIETRYGIDLISQENIYKITGYVTQVIPQLINATFGTLGTLFFMYFVLYFMLVNGEKMETALFEYVPLKDENVDRIGHEIETMVISNAVGIPLIGLLQGLVAVIGYYIIGVKEPWFWFVITSITAMLPVVGAALAYVPLAIIFFAAGQTWQGVFMLIYGFGVIGTVDNVFRFTLARKFANVHPLITVFGVIIGLQLFGFLGLIFGPLLISMFILLLRIYGNEFFVKQREVVKP